MTQQAIAVSSESDQAAARKAVADNPLMAAPAPLRHAIWRVWTCHQHLFPSPLPLAGAVAVWVREFGLREDDAAVILAGLMSPDRMATHRFHADLMTSLAAGASEAIRRRRAEAEAAERAAAERVSPTERAAARELLAELLTGIGQPPG